MFAYNSILAISICTSLWTSLYFIIGAILQNKSAEYCNRLVVLVHGLLVVALGTADCYGSHEPFGDLTKESTNRELFIILMSAGYFYFDLGWCIAMSSETHLMIAHHVYSCYVLTRMLFRSGGAAFVCGLSGLELTNPLLQCRWLLRSEGYHESFAFTVVEIAFIVLFIAVRVLLGTYLGLRMLFNSTIDLEYFVMVVMIYVLSWMFMVNILRYFVYRYVKTAPPQDAQQNDDLRENS